MRTVDRLVQVEMPYNRRDQIGASSILGRPYSNP